MPKNEDITRCQEYSAQTSKIENGDIKVEKIVLKNVAVPLFILFVYGVDGKDGGFAFLEAAKFKKERLAIKYPEAEIRIIKVFNFSDNFKAEWTKLYNELTQTETACKYSLWEVHYFGHGSPASLTFKNGLDVFFSKHDNMEKLPWHPNQGIFVLHSCQGAAYEHTYDKKIIKNQGCLAKTISEQQNTRCLGQVIYANFNAIDILIASHPDPFITMESGNYSYGVSLYESIEKQQHIIDAGIKNRSEPYSNFIKISLGRPKVLWGYALLTGETGKRLIEDKKLYEEDHDIPNSDVPKKYPIYEEVEKLASKNQILPCRVFNNGKLEERIVELDVFNKNDLEYI